MHLGLMICVNMPGHHWFSSIQRQAINCQFEPVLMYCKFNPLEKTSWNLNQNIQIVFHKNVSENVIFKMSANLFKPWNVNGR